MSTFEGECDHPFSFFYLSSEDCRAHNADDVDADLPLDPAEPRKQATTHINVTSDAGCMYHRVGLNENNG